ncbi:MAG: hypothetical protein K9G58_10100 [Bacteroidales bacterium]|nr:hypothetical protein [Bacteroidales bacterium]MCF8387705.1 hypothetical protein [Bacteroidales bacterium]MCF8398511.1 hypothetical protein [Bacteroidales bacterium]
MNRIKVLNIEFENDIFAYELPAFRGAIAESAGKDHVLFHNHQNNKYLYQYPLIQYKRIGKKPAIICIEDGIDEIHHFFSNKQEGLILGERHYELKIAKLHMNQFVMQVWDKSFHYNLWNWLALNQKNYSEYKNIESEFGKIEFLEKILTGNILSFAKGIGWQLDKELKVRIKEIKQKKIITVKNTKREALSLVFTSNAFLPNYIGLGKNASLGFGMVKEITYGKKSNHGERQL